MNTRIYAAMVGLALVIGGLGALAGLDSCRKHEGAANEHNAAVASGEANAHQSQAQAHDATVENLKAQLSARETDVGRLNAERDGLLKRLASKPRPVSDPADAGAVGSNDSALEAAEAVIAKDAEVIDALEADSVVKDSLITEALRSRDEWKATAEARERQALAQEAATEAWKKAVTTSKWRGRIEGFAVGLASGYVAGRLK